MRSSIALPAAAALIAGYVLGAAAGRGRHRKIAAAVTIAASTAVHHLRVRQLLFDLADRASSDAVHIPGPAADLVHTAAAHLQDILTQPDHPNSAPAEPIPGRHIA